MRTDLSRRSVGTAHRGTATFRPRGGLCFVPNNLIQRCPMRKFSLLLAASLLMASARAAAPVSLVQNEYDFAAVVAKQGVRDGFLQYLDKQAVTFAPQPVNAYDGYEKRKPSSTQLTWYPSYALVSASGDFGVDTGPYTAEWMQDGKPHYAYGEWLSVWAKDASGKWKALFDSGIQHAKPQTAVQPLAKDAKVMQLAAAGGAAPAVDDTHDALVRADTVFSNDAARKGLRSAYQSSGAADLRLLLDGSEPLIGQAEVGSVTPEVPAGLEWVALGGSAARSGDLGYVYGMTYKTGDTLHQVPQGTYMHVWRKDPVGWKLIIAEETPLPAQ